MTEPRTAAGRALERALANNDMIEPVRVIIAGIEAEARAAALDEARVAVQAIELPGYYHPRTDRALAAIDALREGADKK